MKKESIEQAELDEIRSPQINSKSKMMAEAREESSLARLTAPKKVLLHQKSIIAVAQFIMFSKTPSFYRN